ncbi:hypothetical protein HOY80DRAFT_1062285 [Tuber brumale]|nr:hypothetical protein HOY80DRAFT_1062285 [Tuber brumale]
MSGRRIPPLPSPCLPHPPHALLYHPLSLLTLYIFTIDPIVRVLTTISSIIDRLLEVDKVYIFVLIIFLPRFILVDLHIRQMPLYRLYPIDQRSTPSTELILTECYMQISFYIHLGQNLCSENLSRKARLDKK